MTNAEFWNLIESAKTESGGECESQAGHLLQLLLKLPPEEMIAFDNIFNYLRRAAYQWDLWGAAYLMNGGASDDGFEYFRCWLIAQGQTIYDNALTDPDSLADIYDPKRDDYECEAIWYVAGQAYMQLTGKEMEPQDFPTGAVTRYDSEGNHVSPEPVGTRWTGDDIDTLLPRITMRFNDAYALQEHDLKDETD